jgi:hypothetical protein
MLSGIFWENIASKKRNGSSFGTSLKARIQSVLILVSGVGKSSFPLEVEKISNSVQLSRL